MKRQKNFLFIILLLTFSFFISCSKSESSKSGEVTNPEEIRRLYLYEKMKRQEGRLHSQEDIHFLYESALSGKDPAQDYEKLKRKYYRK